ncbi:PA0069 family radical SAM protein [Eoetvoesiella caeni]|uniref:DNA repair photolyase n=1 Tax=Eoetvoesiella caeni TaxID=645616 RepID=A0A366HAB5_9BURK|nr:PA0069 family radical SAM protein [Eoetvoesiella caeni]MCI2809420.1 PA0069 family radical SAM protein [Eoetvoesiella caeni]NYT54561.1 PA0069 family radical SAM protein [Eoetvoesiella caeni]RBP39249.1 DNA repair photolyase [Eoetvoesiella caeni]
MQATPPIKGRGSVSNKTSRFEQLQRESFDDEWAKTDEAAPKPATTVSFEKAKSIISRNESPDISFDQSINPYRGCEHGCIYCYARPTHAYLNHSPGLDFETKLYAKSNAAELLRKELSRPNYVPKLIALGANTDPYQPIERRLRITASILAVMEEFNQPVAITTKSASVTQDIELLARMASKNLVRVFMSVGSLDRTIARTLEPRASTPGARIDAIRTLSAAGIPTGVMVAPVIPALTDHDMEKILFSAQDAGAKSAAYVLLRLPLEIADLFREWLAAHHPLKEAHVMNLVKQMRNGKIYDSDFKTRMKGTGVFADLLEQRFKKACAKAGLNQTRQPLDTTLFSRPPEDKPQLTLF